MALQGYCVLAPSTKVVFMVHATVVKAVDEPAVR